MPEHKTTLDAQFSTLFNRLADNTALTPPLRWTAAALGLLLLGAAAPPVMAQGVGLQAGEGFATRFSGVDSGGGAPASLNVNGTVGSIIDLRNPGTAAKGQHWLNEPQRADVSAGSVGQVFGIAFDNAVPPNIYLTATSAFGLHRLADNSGWMPGMWGPSGGAGTVYRLNAANGYQPEVFANITLDGRPNSGAALGNIAFDSGHNQLFVSDMETGMIHRISAVDGRELGRFDHGTEGRVSFFDGTAGQSRALAAVAFNPNSGPQINNCGGAGFAKTPACWNVADFRRRVWGLGVNREADGPMRLYYAIWGSQALGNPAWQGAGEDQSNSVWSVAIGPGGELNRGDVRREFTTPGFFTNLQDFRRAGGSHPISDIAFSADGTMLLAERGGLRNSGLDKLEAFAAPHESRVIRFEKTPTGQWVPSGRYDIGFYDRKDHGQPFLRASSSGGVDFGFAYSAAGQIDLSQRDGWVWTSGDGLCSPKGPCFNTATNAFDDSSRVDGLQGQPTNPSADLAPPGAYQAYPASGPATPLNGPERAYMIDLEINVTGAGAVDQASLRTNNGTHSGDIEIYRPVGAPAALIPPPTGFDLSIFKSGPARCTVRSRCSWQITVTNNGPAIYSGPINISDILTPFGAAFTNASPPWACTDFGAGAGQWVQCYHPLTTLQPGQSLRLSIEFSIPIAYRNALITNCAEILWPMRNAGELSPNLIRDVQSLLGLLGYQAGPADGILGNMLRNAIRVFQNDNGLQVTGLIDAALLAALYPQGAGLTGDMNPANDRACASTGVDLGHLPPGSVHLPIGSFHRPPKSPHFPVGSFHRPPKSPHFPVGSFHRPGKSPHFPKGSFHRPGKSPHYPRGSFHRTGKSPHLPKGSFHRPGKSPHYPRGSFHRTGKSPHLPKGSFHRPGKSPHLPRGSFHRTGKSPHLPKGSFHRTGKSPHLPRGSFHRTGKSPHLPKGSFHRTGKSPHMPRGSGMHVPAGSKVHKPAGSKVHLPRRSNVHKPVGSKVHFPRKSRVHQPRGSRVHLPRGSRVHKPVGSRVHLPRGSRIKKPVIRKPHVRSKVKTKVIRPQVTQPRVRRVNPRNN